MNQSNKSDAQKRVDQISTFRKEIEQLKDEGVVVLTEKQLGDVNTHHKSILTNLEKKFNVDLNNQASQLSLGMKAVSFLGAVALMASLFFLFYQYWGFISTTTQVVILFGAPMLLYMVTLLTGMHDQSGYFVKLAASVTFASFVINLVLYGQIFNITPTDNALLGWAAFAFILT